MTKSAPHRAVDALRQLPMEALAQGFADAGPLAHVSCVLLIGSWAEGLGTCMSDVDVVLVYPDDIAAGLGEGSFRRGAVGGTVVDLLLVSESYLARCVAATCETNLGNRSVREIEICYKLVRAEALFGAERYGRLISGFDRERFARQLVQRYDKLSRDGYDDFAGSFLSDQKHQAIEFAKDVLRLCVDQTLVTLGDLYPKPKWRIRRLERAAVDRPSIARLYEAYVRLEHGLVKPGGEGAGSVDDVAEDCLALARHLKAIVLASTNSGGGGPPRLNPARLSLPFALDEGYAIKVLDRSFVVSERVARQYLACCSYAVEPFQTGDIDTSNSVTGVTDHAAQTELLKQGLVTVSV